MKFLLDKQIRVSPDFDRMKSVVMDIEINKKSRACPFIVEYYGSFVEKVVYSEWKYFLADYNLLNR